MDKITPKQECFANEYIKTLNVTQSAINAGYSSNSAHVTGSRLLRNEKVKIIFKARKDEIMDDTILSAEGNTVSINTISYWRRDGNERSSG